MSDLLDNVTFPEEWPFKEDDFKRYDEGEDAIFYSEPRFVTHIDDGAIGALTKWYGENLPPTGTPGAAVLDICSSWISHYPEGYSLGRVVGLGMNELELERNSQLDEFVVKDLNEDPKLPFEDNSFDAVTNAVSVDYLVHPQALFAEIARVLKPGGIAAMSFSNRCFPTKAIDIWTRTSDADHVVIVAAYFHYQGNFERARVADISPNAGRSDPMYVVYATKKKEE